MPQRPKPWATFDDYGYKINVYLPALPSLVWIIKVWNGGKLIQTIRIPIAYAPVIGQKINKLIDALKKSGRISKTKRKPNYRRRT